MIRVEQPADVLGVELIGTARVADQVGEEHRDRAALLGRGRLRERHAAGAAEAEADRIVLAAARADEHRAISLACARAAALPYARARSRALATAFSGSSRRAPRRSGPTSPTRTGSTSRPAPPRSFPIPPVRPRRACAGFACGPRGDRSRSRRQPFEWVRPRRFGVERRYRGRAACNDASARGARATSRRRHDARVRDSRDAARSPRATAGGDRPRQGRAAPFRARPFAATIASPWLTQVSPSVRRSGRRSSCPAGASVSSGPATRSSGAASTRR